MKLGVSMRHGCTCLPRGISLETERFSVVLSCIIGQIVRSLCRNGSCKKNIAASDPVPAKDMSVPVSVGCTVPLPIRISSL